MARTWLIYPQPASVTLNPTNSVKYAAEDRIFIKIPIDRTRSRAVRLRPKRLRRTGKLQSISGYPKPSQDQENLYFRPVCLDTSRSFLALKPIHNSVVIRFEDLLDKVRGYS